MDIDNHPYNERLPEVIIPIKDMRLEQEIERTIEELMLRNTKNATRAYWKSVVLKALDRTIRFLSITIGIAIGVLGIGIANDASNTAQAQASAALGFSIAGLIQLREEFNFDARSVVLMNCYHKFDEANNFLQKLRFSNDTPIKILDRIYKLERKIHKVNLSVFDSTVIDIDPEDLFSKKASNDIIRNVISNRRDHLRDNEVK